MGCSLPYAFHFERRAEGVSTVFKVVIELLLSKDSLGYVYNLSRKSEQMLQVTIAGNTKVVEEILQFAHDTEAPILSYNSEVELSAVVNLCYLSARNRYRVEREDKAGKGYALRSKGKLGEKNQYTGRILAVGISYGKKSKKHSCNIEVLKDEHH